jgi:hypothetical protein
VPLENTIPPPAKWLLPSGRQGLVARHVEVQELHVRLAQFAHLRSDVLGLGQLAVAHRQLVGGEIRLYPRSGPGGPGLGCASRVAVRLPSVAASRALRRAWTKNESHRSGAGVYERGGLAEPARTEHLECRRRVHRAPTMERPQQHDVYVC